MAFHHYRREANPHVKDILKISLEGQTFLGVENPRNTCKTEHDQLEGYDAVPAPGRHAAMAFLYTSPLLAYKLVLLKISPSSLDSPLLLPE